METATVTRSMRKFFLYSSFEYCVFRVCITAAYRLCVGWCTSILLYSLMVQLIHENRIFLGHQFSFRFFHFSTIFSFHIGMLAVKMALCHWARECRSSGICSRSVHAEKHSIPFGAMWANIKRNAFLQIRCVISNRSPFGLIGMCVAVRASGVHARKLNWFVYLRRSFSCSFVRLFGVRFCVCKYVCETVWCVNAILCDIACNCPLSSRAMSICGGGGDRSWIDEHNWLIQREK